MKMTQLLVLFLLVSMTTSLASAADRTVAVTGTCTRPVTSDRGAITLTAEFTEKDLQAATRKAGEAYDRTRDAVKRLNLGDLDLRTSEYQVAEHKEWEKDRLVFKGFRARMGIRVATSQVQRLGEVIAIGSREGLRDVGQLQTFLSEEKLRKEHLACLEEAARNARAKADKLAAALSANVSEVLSISEEGGGAPVQPMVFGAEVRTMKAAPMAEMAPPQVEAGKQEITLTVRAVFKL